MITNKSMKQNNKCYNDLFHPVASPDDCSEEDCGGENVCDLSKRTFTFIGAGFPLTGVILHVVTGARINLVDCDPEAVRNARR